MKTKLPKLPHKWGILCTFVFAYDCENEVLEFRTRAEARLFAMGLREDLVGVARVVKILRTIEVT